MITMNVSTSLEAMTLSKDACELLGSNECEVDATKEELPRR